MLEQAVATHELLFGHVPEVSAGDKGFYSKETVENLKEMGVEKICVPKKGRRNAEEEQREKSY